MALRENVAVIILAAGSSSRLGAPKQQLPYAGQTLLQHVIKTAVDSTADSVIVVLGANKELIDTPNHSSKIKIVVNAGWQEGMASSVRCGVNELLQLQTPVEGAVIMLCDQPHASSGLISQLISTHHVTGKPIVACSYSDIIGAPTFFHKSLFPDLLLLKGDIGARNVIQQHIKDVEIVEFAQGRIDIDTAEDWERWKI